jgi:hypothetical protein
MRKGVIVLMAVGAAALVVAWPLWHVVRPDVSGCTHGPCDPSETLPFGSLALALTLLATVTLVAAALLLGAGLVRAALRRHAEDRAQ